MSNLIQDMKDAARALLGVAAVIFAASLGIAFFGSGGNWVKYWSLVGEIMRIAGIVLAVMYPYAVYRAGHPSRGSYRIDEEGRRVYEPAAARFSEVNPTTGLPMMGLTDSGGSMRNVDD